MTPQEIALVADLVRRRSGVVVDVDKTYLIESRLAPVARREGFPGVSGLIREIAERRDEKLIWPVVEAMASTETLFFAIAPPSINCATTSCRCWREAAKTRSASGAWAAPPDRSPIRWPCWWTRNAAPTPG